MIKRKLIISYYSGKTVDDIFDELTNNGEKPKEAVKLLKDLFPNDPKWNQ